MAMMAPVSPKPRPAFTDMEVSAVNDPALARALAFIQSRFAEDLSIDAIAGAAAVSRANLGRRFVAALGETPMRYAVRWRLRVAEAMLRESRESAASIAFAVGFGSEAAFTRAFRREYGFPPIAWKQRTEREAALGPAVHRDEIRHCRTDDGSELSYAISGDGHPLIRSPMMMTPPELDWSSPFYRHWTAECARANRFVRIQSRSLNFSKDDREHLWFDAAVSDIGAVMDDVGLDCADLIGISTGAALAIAFAARNPHRVRKLVVANGFAAGWVARGDRREIAWRQSSAAFDTRQVDQQALTGRTFISMVAESDAGEIWEWWSEHLDKIVKDPDDFAHALQLSGMIDVRDELTKVKAKTLVIHSARSIVQDRAQGKAIADGIDGASYLEVDSANHAILESEPAWPIVKAGLRRFLHK